MKINGFSEILGIVYNLLVSARFFFFFIVDDRTKPCISRLIPHGLQLITIK